MVNPTIIGDATGSVMPNPAYYGFKWPELQDDLDRAHGQHLLDIAAARMQQGSAEDPALEVLRRAHQEQADKQ